MNWNPERLPDLTGRVYVVTGATGGIGYFAAEQLASAGAEVVLASRSREKLQRASEAIREQAPGAVTHHTAIDLTSLASVRAAADQLASLRRLDGIFLNGGPMHFSRSARTEDGLPLMLGAHTVANVALVARLLPVLADQDVDRPRRVVHASTGFVRQFPTSVADVERTPRTGIGAYVKAKTATEVFAFELDRRLRAAGLPLASIVTSPGVGVDARTPRRAGIRDKTVPYRRNPYTPWAQGKDAAAWSGVRALTDPEAAGGEYYAPAGGARGEPVLIAPDPRTSTPEGDVAERVWNRLVELSGADPLRLSRLLAAAQGAGGPSAS
ncbi:SDR family NAD(P)-dependent oxidoreductase [Isoptericola halotolerans]|uniref:NAD(P)-dependent dehydrogenase (Short-subunit alcohol dehydrogenase family) n=1 Tax=Isoptericola halotolerans TaxID=300560 RepID=A0ABX2A9C0_9MICO|nr:SDR family NAD(P)-dependent oxidoreductase [Isoptericola halotolerans]NOV98628.1 NAD(P)-dependent dehydrogenase (short-subunit alcohol dehydrogenase family) [Isoptericola halotolerans]